MGVKGLWAVLMGVVFSTSSFAIGGWKLTPGFLAQESYNDNLTLVDEGDKVTDFVTELTPSLSVNRRSRKLDLTLDYRMQNLIYAGESQYNTTYSQFRGVTTAKVVRDLFFIDASASYGQQTVSNAGTITLNNSTISGNRTNTTVASVRPYIKRRLGHTAEIYMAAERGVVRYSGNLDGSERNYYQATLSSGTSFRRLLWRLNYSRQDISSANQSDVVLREYLGSLEYHLTARFALLASSGYDDNVYTQGGLTSNRKGAKWTTGFKWVVTPHTSIEASTGKRYFGRTHALKVMNRARKTDISLAYDETITVLASTLFDANSVPQTASTDATSQASVLGSGVDSTLPSVSNASFVRKRLIGEFTLRGDQSMLTLSLFVHRRFYELSDREERIEGGSALYDWDFSQRTRLILSTTGQLIDLADRGTNKFLRFRASVETKLSPKLVSSFSLLHNRQGATLGSLNYDQNIAYARIVWEL